VDLLNCTCLLRIVRPSELQPTKNLSSHIDMHANACSEFNKHVTLTITLPTHRLQLETVNMRRRFTQLDVM